MIPNKAISPNVNTTPTIGANTSYTFIDSYIYMKNEKFNAMYSKNKDILAMENEAIQSNSANILFAAAYEQTKVLNSIIVRIRNFAQSVKNDVVQNIKELIPNDELLRDYHEALKGLNKYPIQKLLKYNVYPIQYPNMSVFYSLFNQEIESFANHKEKTISSNPFRKNPATKYLIDTAAEFAFVNENILSSEKCIMTNNYELMSIYYYFYEKSKILTDLNNSFKTFHFYLRQYKLLNNIIRLIQPTIMIDGRILIGDSKIPLESFNDYLILYKHYTMMVKYMIDIISCYDARFFNKIYSIQSNIEMYRTTINSVISTYKLTMRNAVKNESFNDLSSIIMGIDTANELMNDDVTNIDLGPEPDAVFGEKSPTEDYLDDDKCYNMEFEIDNTLNYDLYDNGHMPKVQSVESKFRELDESINSLDNIYTFTSPEDLMSYNKKYILNEASDEKDKQKEIIEDIVNTISNNNDKFKESAKTIKVENAQVLKKAKELEIDSMDLSGVTFEMYDYPKGCDVMHRIRIPEYKSEDSSLLTNEDGVEYKQKYFKDLFYFSYKNQPLNKNKLRGSQAKKVIEDDEKIKEIFDFFINFINNYHNIVNSVGNANNRIMSALSDAIDKVDESYGENEELMEAVIFNRSMYKNNIFNILLEADGDDEEESSEENAETEDINMDDDYASESNDSAVDYESIRMYCKIAYEVNSSRMDIYEEVYETGFKFLSMITNSSDNDETSEINSDDLDDEEFSDDELE